MDSSKPPMESLPPEWQRHIRELERTIDRLLLKLQKKGRAEKKLREQRQRPPAQ